MIQTINKGTIRMLGADEVDRALPLALEFQKASGLLTGDKEAQESWNDVWVATIESGTGGIIAYEVDGEVAGVMCFHIGISPLDGVYQLSEVMWYLQETHRGEGMLLLTAAEELARAQGCKRVFMGHLADAKADRLGKIFKRRGFRPTEIYYLKDL